jgi:hypothetical protein
MGKIKPDEKLVHMDGLIVEMPSSVKGEFTGQPSKRIQAPYYLYPLVAAT